MKIGGVEPTLAEEVLVLPRLGEDIIIRAKAVQDMDAFDAQCPMPKAPAVLVKGGFKEDLEAPSYLAQIEKHGELKLAFIAINSLLEMEWDTVDIEKPSTWRNWEKDLLSAGLSTTEVNRVLICVMQANCLDEGKLKEARDFFLRGRAVAEELSSGQEIAPQTTPSGEDAAVSV